MNKSTFFILIINEHNRYLNNITSAIEKNNSFSSVSASHCQLGRWLFNEGSKEVEQYGKESVSLVSELNKAHELFHKISHEILHIMGKENKKEIENRLTQMHLASGKLISLLLKLDLENSKLQNV